MGILRPEPMRKVGVLGLTDDREAVLTALHDLRVAQIEPVCAETLQYLEPERASETQRSAGDEALRFRGLKAALPSVPVPQPMRFQDLPAILAAARTVPIDAEVGALVREDDRLQTELKGLRETVTLLGKLAFYHDPLDDLSTRTYLPFLAEGPLDLVDRLRATYPAETEVVTVAAPDPARAIVLFPRSHADLVGRVLPSSGIRLTAVPTLARSVPEETARLEEESARVTRRRAEIRARLAEISKEWYPLVAALEEALSIQNRLFEVYTKLGRGPNTFAVEGWVPRRELDRLRAAIERVSSGRAYFYLVPTREEPPTLMRNPAGVRRYEFFIRFYSLPQATEWDPTIVFAIVFPIFFGLMLGDWGYGLVILGISLWMIGGFPGGRYVPRALRNFVTRIMSPPAMRQLAYALLPGCAIAIGLGLYFDEFFGFAVLHTLFGYTAPFSPLANVGTLLVIAGYIGVAMVTFGFLLGAIKETLHHHPREAVAKVGGIIFTWGIALFGLYVIHQHGFSGSLLYPYLGVVIAGLVVLLVGEGGFGIMGLIEIVSHILSYTRLVGILLASVVLASVIDLIGTHLPHHFPAEFVAVGIFVGAIILVIGQAFNVVLGVFEPGIQGARLIFVEYFSKFYTGNGRPFRPFGSERAYTAPPEPPGGTPSGASPLGPILRAPEP